MWKLTWSLDCDALILFRLYTQVYDEYEEAIADKAEILASASCMTVVCLRADRYEEDGSAESTWACEAGR